MKLKHWISCMLAGSLSACATPDISTEVESALENQNPIPLYSSFLGGTGGDNYVHDVATDALGNTYYTGSTRGGWGAQFGSTETFATEQAFVLKVTRDGGLGFLVLLKGINGSQAGKAIAVGPSGNIFVAGHTSSFDFRVTPPVSGSNFERGWPATGGQVAFVTKLSPSGGVLSSSLLSQGARYVTANGIAIDKDENVYLTGNNSAGTFQSYGGATTAEYGQGVVVAALSSNLETLILAGSVGSGYVWDTGHRIAKDPITGNVVIVGETSSAKFPAVSTSGTKPLQDVFGGWRDGFALVLSSSADRIVASTYVGGTGIDFMRGVGLDGAGNIYIAGSTETADLEKLTPLDGHHGASDCFVAKLDPQLAPIWTRYLGGSAADHCEDLAVDPDGRSYVTGGTSSLYNATKCPASLFPVTDGSITSWPSPFECAYPGVNQTAFVTALDSNGGLAASTALPPANDMIARGIARWGDAVSIGGSVYDPFHRFRSLYALQDRTGRTWDGFAASINFASPTPMISAPHIYAVGNVGTAGPAPVVATVRIYEAAAGGDRLKHVLSPYPGFTGEVRVAVADVNGDGTLDVITAPGPGGGPRVKAFSGKDLTLLHDFMAYDPGFGGGIYVAAGDVDGDGKADIITGPDSGGGPHLKVFSGKNQSVLREFMAFDPRFTGGIRVAAGDLNKDGFADIIVAAGPTGGPHVQAFSGRDHSPLASFFAYPSSFTGGVYVATGDTDGDGFADIITGAGAGGSPHVQVFSGRLPGTVLLSFMAYASGFTGGVRVGSALVDGDRRADVLTVPGPTGGPHLNAISGASTSSPITLQSFWAQDNPSSYSKGLTISGQ